MTSAVTSAWWFVTLKVEWSGGRGVLNLMPVKDLTAISGSMASSEHPPADHTHSSFLHTPIRQPSSLAFFIDGEYP